MGWISQFLWGFAGSFASEVVLVNRVLSRHRALPKQFNRVTYWINRLLLAVSAGLMAVAFQVQSPRDALAIGIATPFIVNELARNPDKRTS